MIQNSLRIQSAFYSNQTKEAEKLRHGAKQTVSASSYMEDLATTTERLRLEREENAARAHDRRLTEQELEQHQQMLIRER